MRKRDTERKKRNMRKRDTDRKKNRDENEIHKKKGR